MLLVHIMADIFFVFVAGHAVKLIFQWVGHALKAMSPDAFAERRKKKLESERRVVIREIHPPEAEPEAKPREKACDPYTGYVYTDGEVK